MEEKDLKKLVEKHRDAVVALRRHFHTYPEIGGKEFKTQEKIMAELAALGLEPRKAAGTGVIAELQGALPGKTVAIRADIDALPIQDDCRQPYQSQHENVCHACGHDGHTAMLLGLAKVFTDLKGELAGNIRFLFQPSEERFPGGALGLIEAGALDGVDAIIGAHLWQPLKVGTIGVTYGRMMASPDEFSITVQGRGGHGSMPQQTVDPILVGAQIVLALNTIVSRNVDPMENAVVSLGVFKAGDIFNVIPDTAVLHGTVRTFEQEVRLKIFERIEQIVKNICEAAGASYKLDKFFGYPPVFNNPAVSKVIAAAGCEVLGPDGVVEIKPVMGGEDFSYYLQKVPGAFVYVGAGNAEKGIIYPHHHPKFDIDESALAYGVEIMARAALKLLA
ncbi:amidohydrolase [Thermosinus carboxydivorans Nor1]|uniref:Amidohydrolase n=1 Tax=Thermosinus carboxydivorans Nor1 TaxID=401526 RepID=A1HQW7_9FIRM|nr:amidohydrolase [Thermosinus carboxydivorans]EAX47675.1 amidohydrolase [Thermosinus carboxydivorans Nor1]